MEDVEMFGPIQGTFLCRLSKELMLTASQGAKVTVAAVRVGDVLTDRPGGEQVIKFTVTGEDKYFLMQTGEKVEPGESSGPEGKKDVMLAVNGKEVAIEPRMDTDALTALEEMFSQADKIDSEGMISHATDTLLKDSKQRVKLVLKELMLRNLDTESKTNRGLIRRVQSARKRGESEAVAVTSQQLQQVCLDLKDCKDKEDIKACFWSLETSLGATKKAAKELLQGPAAAGTRPEEIPLISLLKMFGLVGIPVSHEVQNYTDPMNIGINEGLKDVTPSSSCHLSQNSLWYLSGSPQIETLVQHTGFQSKVTAIVPIKSWNHPAVWKAFHKTTNLGKFMLSAQLRGTGTPLPNDRSAFTAASLLRSIQLWPRPNQSEATLMADLLDTIQFDNHNPATIKDFMDFPDVHIINNMPSALAPVARLLESKELLSYAGSEKSATLWRAIFSNSIFWKVKRAVGNKGKRQGKNRPQLIRSLVDLDSKTVNIEALKGLAEDPTVFSQIFQIAKKFKVTQDTNNQIFKENQENKEEFQMLVADYNFNLFQAVEVTKALLCKKSTWRLKRQKYRFLNSTEEAWQWLNEVHENQEQETPLQYEPDGETTDDFFENLGALALKDFSLQLGKVIPNQFDKVQTNQWPKTQFKTEKVLEKLMQPGVVALKEKLQLLLFGKVRDQSSEFSTHIWRDGQTLLNKNIAETILGILIPLMDEHEVVMEEVTSLKQDLTFSNKLIKHYYRTKGSRKRYTNDNPSFWAITGFTDPWSFMKKNKARYTTEFLETLASLREETSPVKHNFFNSWKHLLGNDPTSQNTSGRGGKPCKQRQSLSPPIKSNCNTSFWDAAKHSTTLIKAKNKFMEPIQPQLGTRLHSIFPHPKDTSLGLKLLLEKMEISDVKTDTNSISKVASNWATVLQKMLPMDKSNILVHSINEIFDMNETSFKAFTAFNILQEMPEVLGRGKDLTAILNQLVSSSTEEYELKEKPDDSNNAFTNTQMKIFQKHYIRILERLLPLRAHELRTAIETIFKKKQVLKMAATYHIIQRYSDLGLTSMKALLRLLGDESLIMSTEHILSGPEERSMVYPSVDFELKFAIEGDSDTAAIKSALTSALHAVKTEENLILWLNQEYHRKCSKYNWETLDKPITSKELEGVSTSVEDIWYGTYYHERIVIDFDYQKYNSDKEIEGHERQRLNQLKNFFHLALENMYQIVPTYGEFVLNDDTWMINKKIEDPEKRISALEIKVKALWNGMQKDKGMIEEAASLFQALGDKGVYYNDSLKIYNLLKTRPTDVDNMVIRIQERPETPGQVNVIDSGSIFICPEKNQRFKELPENIYLKVHEVMTREIVDSKIYKEAFDILIHLNDPKVFDSDTRDELEDDIKNMAGRAKLSKILKKYKEQNGTFGGLLAAFEAIRKKYPKDREMVTAMTSLIDRLDTIMQDSRKLSEEQAPKLYAKKNSIDMFITFLENHKPDGMKKYAKQHAMKKEEFETLINNNTVIPGDMVCFFRKLKGLEYAHAAILGGGAALDQRMVAHVHQQEERSRISKDCEVRCERLLDVIKKNDKIFFVRACSKRQDQERFLARVVACLNPNPIKYEYDGYFGSCQTFCMKIFEMQGFKELNPEAFLSSGGRLKRFAGRLASNQKKALDLVRLMDERFANPDMASVSLGGEDDSLVKMYPDSIFQAL